MNLVPLMIQLLNGAVGGNIAGALLEKPDLALFGNHVARLVGGGLRGQLLSTLISGGAAFTPSAGTATSGAHRSTMLWSVGGCGVGGAVIVAIVALMKAQMAKS